MRGRTRYAGAMLLYGPQAQPPDLTLAMQFLIDDLRFDGRRVTWVALKGNSLRLRVEGFELVLAHTDGALPPQAFQGVLRPFRGSLAEGETDGDGAPVAGPARDLARGRVLHSLRHHPCALSVLLRPRGSPPRGGDGDVSHAGPDSTLDALIRECRALLEPVIEAAPPATVIWQPGAVAYTCEEFLASRAETLALPGDAAHPLQLVTEKERPRHRPALHGFGDVSDKEQPALPAPTDSACPPATGTPHSRAGRAAQRSAGQLFGTAHRSGRPVALPRLHRQDARLAEALRARPAPEADAAEKARKRRLNLARAANIAALALWYVMLLPPAAGGL